MVTNISEESIGSIFREKVTPLNLLHHYECFRETCCLCVQERRLLLTSSYRNIGKGLPDYTALQIVQSSLPVPQMETREACDICSLRAVDMNQEGLKGNQEEMSELACG
jgi:hypothetical protein